MLRFVVAMAVLALFLGGAEHAWADTIAYYRFEEGTGTSLVNSVNGLTEGTELLIGKGLLGDGKKCEGMNSA